MPIKMLNVTWLYVHLFERWSPLNVTGKKTVHKLRLSVEDMMGVSDSKSKSKNAAVKRRRSPSPTGVGSMKPGTPSGTPGSALKRKSLRPTLGKKFRGEDDSDDLTRDMEDPPSDTNLREVEVPKPNVGAGTGGASSGASNTRKDSDWMPSKGSLLQFVFESFINHKLMINRTTYSSDWNRYLAVRY